MASGLIGVGHIGGKGSVVAARQLGAALDRAGDQLALHHVHMRPRAAGQRLDLVDPARLQSDLGELHAPCRCDLVQAPPVDAVAALRAAQCRAHDANLAERGPLDQLAE